MFETGVANTGFRPARIPSLTGCHYTSNGHDGRRWFKSVGWVSPQVPEIAGKNKWSGRVDLNHRPPGPEPGALARLRYAPTVSICKKAASCRDIKNSTGTAGPTRPHLPIKPLAFTYSTNARPPKKLALPGGSCLVFPDSKIRNVMRTASRADWWTTACIVQRWIRSSPSPRSR
jgi:hypothetical protein